MIIIFIKLFNKEIYMIIKKLNVKLKLITIQHLLQLLY